MIKTEPLTTESLKKLYRSLVGPEVIPNDWLPRGTIYAYWDFGHNIDPEWSMTEKLQYVLDHSAKIAVNIEDWQEAIRQSANGDAVDRFENEGGPVT